MRNPTRELFVLIACAIPAVLQATPSGQAAPAALLTPGYALTPEDYPPEALALAAEGRVVARLLIGKTGTIEDCSIIESSGNAALDAGTCTALERRARFAPARDDAGRPVAIHYRAPINWAIPPSDGERLVPSSLRVSATFDRDGAMSGCGLMLGQRNLTLAPAECRQVAHLFSYVAIREATANGTRPVRAVAEQRKAYGGQEPAASSTAGTLLTRVATSFEVGADGRGHRCSPFDTARESMFDHGSPCGSAVRFDLSGTDPASLPLRGSWSVTLVAVPLESASALGSPSEADRAASPRNDPSAFFGIDAYPPEAVRRHEQGRTVADLAVGPDGRVAGCAVAQTSGSASLDAATCRIARERLTFTAARDEAGHVVASHYTLPVRWIMPASDAIPLAPMTMVLDATINASRTVVACRVTINGQQAAAGLGACSGLPQMFAVAFAAQATGAQANTVRAIVERRYAYGPEAPPERPTRGAVLLAETVTRFRIEADGKPHNCRSGAGDGDYLMHGDNPCRDGARFELVSLPADRLPIEATWTTTASYTRIARP